MWLWGFGCSAQQHILVHRVLCGVVLDLRFWGLEPDGGFGDVGGFEDAFPTESKLVPWKVDERAAVITIACICRLIPICGLRFRRMNASSSSPSYDLLGSRLAVGHERSMQGALSHNHTSVSFELDSDDRYNKYIWPLQPLSFTGCCLLSI